MQSESPSGFTESTDVGALPEEYCGEPYLPSNGPEYEWPSGAAETEAPFMQSACSQSPFRPAAQPHQQQFLFEDLSPFRNHVNSEYGETFSATTANHPFQGNNPHSPIPNSAGEHLQDMGLTFPDLPATASTPTPQVPALPDQHPLQTPYFQTTSPPPPPPPIHPSTSTIYPPYHLLPPTSTFPTAAAARAHRKTHARSPANPSDPTLAAVLAHQEHWVAALYAAFVDTARARDNAATPAHRRFVSGGSAHYEARRIVGACWRLLGMVVEGVERGFVVDGVSAELERRIRGLGEGEGGMGAEERLGAVCEGLRLEKTVCVDLLEKGKREWWGFVWAPRAYVVMKEDYRRQNNGRGCKSRKRKREDGDDHDEEEEEEEDGSAQGQLKRQRREKQRGGQQPQQRRKGKDAGSGRFRDAAAEQLSQSRFSGSWSPDQTGATRGPPPSTEHEGHYVRTSSKLGQTCGGKKRGRSQLSHGASPDHRATEDDDSGHASKIRRTGGCALSPASVEGLPLAQPRVQMAQNAVAGEANMASASRALHESFDARQHGPSSPRPPPASRYRFASPSRSGSCASAGTGKDGGLGNEGFDFSCGDLLEDTGTKPISVVGGVDANTFDCRLAMPPQPQSHLHERNWNGLDLAATLDQGFGTDTTRWMGFEDANGQQVHSHAGPAITCPQPGPNSSSGTDFELASIASFGCHGDCRPVGGGGVVDELPPSPSCREPTGRVLR